MKIITAFLSIILLLPSACSGGESEQSVNERAKAYFEQFSDRYLYKGSWFGCGKLDRVDNGGKNMVPLSLSKYSHQPVKEDGRLVVFDNAPIPGQTGEKSRNSLRLSWLHQHRNPYSEAWAAATISSIKPHAWSRKDIRGKKFLEMDVRGLAGGEDLKIDLRDVFGKQTGQVRLSHYKKITRGWQRFVIPLEDFPEFETIDRNQWLSVGVNSTESVGAFTIYLDNIAFSTESPIQVKREIPLELRGDRDKSTLDLMKSRKEKTFTFGDSLNGFEIPALPGGAEHKSAVGLKIASGDIRGHQVPHLLEIELDCKKNWWQMAMVHKRLAELDWSEVEAIGYKIYVPNSAPDGLTGMGYLMFDLGAVWTQDDAPTPLSRGNWTEVIYDLTLQDPKIVNRNNLSRVSLIGISICGTNSKDYQGPVYLSEVSIYRK